MDNTVRLKQVT